MRERILFIFYTVLIFYIRAVIAVSLLFPVRALGRGVGFTGPRVSADVVELNREGIRLEVHSVSVMVVLREPAVGVAQG